MKSDAKNQVLSMTPDADHNWNTISCLMLTNCHGSINLHSDP
jgi:hypothetical protein